MQKNEPSALREKNSILFSHWSSAGLVLIKSWWRDHLHVVLTSDRCLPFFSDFGVLALSSFLSSFLLGLHTTSVTIPSARFNNEAAYSAKRMKKRKTNKLLQPF